MKPSPFTKSAESLALKKRVDTSCTISKSTTGLSAWSVWASTFAGESSWTAWRREVSIPISESLCRASSVILIPSVSALIFKINWMCSSLYGWVLMMRRRSNKSRGMPCGERILVPVAVSRVKKVPTPDISISSVGGKDHYRC